VTTLLLWSALAAPLTLAALAAAPPCRNWVRGLAPWAPLPALVLAIVAAEPFFIEAPWMLLGSRLGLDLTGRVFLGFTAALWLAAGVYAGAYLADDPARTRFFFYHLLTLAGNLGAIVSHDMASFLLFYTLMSLAAYGLITHDRRPASLHAGRIYIVLTVLGEVLVFWGMVLAAQAAGSLEFAGLAERLGVSPMRPAVTGLLLAGFGIKLGIMPLHIWLPLAHPAAPTPASAVLSGAMIKMGLLGLLRTLPLGAAAMPEWGAVCCTLGLVSVFAAALVGMTQTNPKTVLAYSSVSQMGLVTIGLGAALAAPDAWGTILPALLLFAAHHAVAKASLFLGVGVAGCEIRSRRVRQAVIVGLTLAALALAGLPLTAGFAAKAALKDAVTAAPDDWAKALKILLPLTGVTTAILVSRFLWLAAPGRREAHGRLTAGLAISWAFLTGAVVVVFAAVRWFEMVVPAWTALTPEAIWTAVRSILAAGVVVLIVVLRPRLAARLERIRIPEGDLAVPLTAIAAWVQREQRALASMRLPRWRTALAQKAATGAAPALRWLLERLTRSLESELATGIWIALLVIALFAMWIL
jgi:formate hydrogenlyase subunit 3/multisubunit Na+/H+ antiporter MnhD subunit